MLAPSCACALVQGCCSQSCPPPEPGLAWSPGSLLRAEICSSLCPTEELELGLEHSLSQAGAG